MRAAAWIVVALGAAIASSTQPAQPAELQPSSIATEVTPRVAATKGWRRVYRRPVAYKRTRLYVARSDPRDLCLLPPDVIARLNWNGPRCRWIDNVIPGDARLHRRRVVAYRYIRVAR
jgi:hypothetical protein